MHVQTLPATPNPAPSVGVPSLGGILRDLAALIARRFLHDPRLAVLIIPLWQHLTRAASRLDRLRARLAAGPIPPPRPRTTNHSGPKRKSPFPTTSAWLIRALGPEAAAYAAQLASLLANSAAADLLACTAARRTLAPIRRMLGIPPAHKPRPITPASAALASLPPLPSAPPPSAPPRRPPPRPAPIPHHPTIDPRPAKSRRPWWLPPPRLRGRVEPDTNSGPPGL